VRAYASAPAATPGAAAEAPEAALAQQLLQFASIQFTYGEVEDLKSVITAADQLTRGLDPSHPSWGACLRLLLQLLFCDNSKPLHRQLLAFVRKQTPAKQAAAGGILCALVQERLAAATAVTTAAGGGEATAETGVGAGGAATAPSQAAASGGLGTQINLPTGANVATATSTTTSSSSTLPAPTMPPSTAAAVLVVAQAASSITWLPGAASWLAPCAAALMGTSAEAARALLVAAGGSGRPLGPQVLGGGGGGGCACDWAGWGA
jgi:hypothetical protein